MPPLDRDWPFLDIDQIPATIPIQPMRPATILMKSLATCLALSIAACNASHSEHMALLEKYGIGQRDCHPSRWFLKVRPEDAHTVKFGNREAAGECNASKRLVEEIREQHGLWRRYRCKVRGEDVEVSYSTSDNDLEGLGDCNYAYSGDQPFKADQSYTDFPWRLEGR
jgi:hypothetical protein